MFCFSALVTMMHTNRHIVDEVIIQVNSISHFNFPRITGFLHTHTQTHIILYCSLDFPTNESLMVLGQENRMGSQHFLCILSIFR